VEGWHRMINQRLSPKSRFFRFLSVIPELQSEMESDVLQTECGAAARKRLNKWVLKDKKLEELKREFEAKRIFVRQFLKKTQRFSGL
jgi:hypothetical protein